MKIYSYYKVTLLTLIAMLLVCESVYAGDGSPAQVSDITFGLKLVLKVLPDADKHLVELCLENHSNRAINIDRQAVDRATLSIQTSIVQNDSKKGVGVGSITGFGDSTHLSIEQIANNPARMLSIASHESYVVKIDLDKACGDAFKQKNAGKVQIEFHCPHLVLGYADEQPSKKMNDVELVSNSVTIDVATPKAAKGR